MNTLGLKDNLINKLRGGVFPERIEINSLTR